MVWSTESLAVEREGSIQHKCHSPAAVPPAPACLHCIPTVVPHPTRAPQLLTAATKPSWWSCTLSTLPAAPTLRSHLPSLQVPALESSSLGAGPTQAQHLAVCRGGSHAQGPLSMHTPPCTPTGTETRAPADCMHRPRVRGPPGHNPSTQPCPWPGNAVSEPYQEY